MAEDQKENQNLKNTWQVMGEDFCLDPRYNVTDYLGAGAYGVVCSVFDQITQRSYAVKKCKSIFHSRTLAKRTFREIRLLRLVDHDNIIKIRSILFPSNEIDFDCLYLLFDLMVRL
jgi:serine/threonine protein kinase